MNIYSFSRSAVKILSMLAMLCGISERSYSIDMAITVDDLPIFGSVNKEFESYTIAGLFLNGFRKFHLENVYGFINAQQLESFPISIKVLLSWLNSGQLLGNHTYSHPNLDHISADEYIRDIRKNEPILKGLMASKNYHYFRYPFLEEGSNLVKHKLVRDFLDREHYQVAEVTVDFSDWEWDHAFFRCLRKKNTRAIEWLKHSYIEEAVLSLEISTAMAEALFHRQPKHIFLMHIGAFQGLMLEKMLAVFQSRGVNFITLDEAVKDPIYTLRPMLTRKRTDAFLTQIRMSRNLEAPESVKILAKKSQEGHVHRACLSGFN